MPYLDNVYRIYMVMDEPVQVIRCKDQSSVCHQQEYDSHRKIDSNCNLDTSIYELSDIEVLQVCLIFIKNVIIIFICY
jgi:hypothetical protein